MKKSILRQYMQEKDQLFSTDTAHYYISVRQKKRKRHIQTLSIVSAFMLLAIAAIYLPGILFPAWFTPGKQTNTYPIAPDPQGLADMRNAMQNHPDYDIDKDGLTFAEEAEYETDPWITDTDYDGLNDGAEAYLTQTNPIIYTESGFLTRYSALLISQNVLWESPYQYDGVTLKAATPEDRAFGTVTKELSGTYRFINFHGTANFGNNVYAYQINNSVFVPLEKKSDSEWEINEDCEIAILDSPIKEVSRLSCFGKVIIIEDALWQKVASLLPEKGFLTCQKTTTAAVLLNDKTTIMYSDKNFQKTVTLASDNMSSENRFYCVQDRNQLDAVFSQLSKNKIMCCSLLSADGEIQGVVYGYTQNGTLLIWDPRTQKSLGEVKTSFYYQPLLTKDGHIVLCEMFSFTGLGFSSDRGDRITFYGTTELIKDIPVPTETLSTITENIPEITPTLESTPTPEPTSTPKPTPTPKASATTAAPTASATPTATPTPAKTPPAETTAVPSMPVPSETAAPSVSLSDIKSYILEKTNALSGTAIPENSSLYTAAQTMADAYGQNVGSPPEGAKKAEFTISKTGDWKTNASALMDALYPIYLDGYRVGIGIGVSETSAGYYVVVLVTA